MIDILLQFAHIGILAPLWSIKGLTGILTELMKVSDWGLVASMRRSCSSCGKSKGKCSLQTEPSGREVTDNQSSPDRTNCQAQVFFTNTLLSLLSTWLHLFKKGFRLTEVWSVHQKCLAAIYSRLLLHWHGKDGVKIELETFEKKQFKKSVHLLFSPVLSKEWSLQTLALQLGVSRAPAGNSVWDNPKVKSQRRGCVSQLSGLMKPARCMFKSETNSCKVGAAWGSANYYSWKKACEKNPSPRWLLKERKQLVRTYAGENISSWKEWLGILLS